MKILKAIGNLARGRIDAGMIPEKEYTQTLDLAIEALKRVQAGRPKPPSLAFLPLPGETED